MWNQQLSSPCLRKNDSLQKDKLQLEKVNQTLNLYYTNLQTDINQKDLEIVNLREELASHQVNEKQRKKLQAELDEMVLKKKLSYTRHFMKKCRPSSKIIRIKIHPIKK